MSISLADYQKLISQKNIPIVGVGVTAFNRIGPALSVPGYSIFCLKSGTDLSSLRNYCSITSVEAESGAGDGDLELNTSAAVGNPRFGKMVTTNSSVAVLVYKTSPRIWKRLAALGCRVIGNAPEIRDPIEDKQTFWRLAEEVGLPLVPAETLSTAGIDESTYRGFVERLGSRMVVQLADVSGGGKGTFFVNSLADFQAFLAQVEGKQHEFRVSRFVEGPSPSITGCVTRHGVLTGVVQTQILDVAEVGGYVGRRGVFCGHDWSVWQYSESVRRQAEKMATTWGKYLASRGYKGIFGLDLVVDAQTKTVYVVECNPRYTGAFPVYSMLQVASGEIPIDIFQVMEFLDIDYPMDLAAVNESWETPKVGAHLVLRNLFSDKPARVTGDLPAGVYKIKSKVKNQKSKLLLEKVRDGVIYQDIHDEEEFVFTDGAPSVGQVIKPGARLGKLIFKRAVVTKQGQLTDWGKTVVRLTYQGLGLERVES